MAPRYGTSIACYLFYLREGPGCESAYKLRGHFNTRDWEPVTIITLQALLLVEIKGGAGPSSLASHYAWGTDGVCMWMGDGCKVYVDSYMTPNANQWNKFWYMLHLNIFRNELLLNMTRIWVKKSLVSDSNCNIGNLECPLFFLSRNDK